MAEPRTVTASDTWNWTRSLQDYPASAWTLTYYLACGAETPRTIQCAAQGDDHLATVAATASGWPAGDYHWTARVRNEAGEIHTVDSGVLQVLPDPTATVDRRTHAEKCLAAVTAVLEGQMGDPIVKYEIDGVRAERIPHAELVKLRAIYLGAVRRERGGPAAVPILLRFGRV